jgi:hypothetical protein
MAQIGEEVTRKVDYTPGTLEIVEYVRPKYARPEAEQEEGGAIVIAEVPDQVVPKGIPGAGLLTHLMVAKYIDHLPFYRQIEMLKLDHSWAIHKSTVNDWFAAPAKPTTSTPANGSVTYSSASGIIRSIAWRSCCPSSGLKIKARTCSCSDAYGGETKSE